MRLFSFPAISIERFKIEEVRDRGILWLFTATIFLSAYLLFLIQPMFAKMILPLLGGAPAVWAVAMVFFQTALLLGYCYAHLIIAKLDLRTGVILHICVLSAAFILLPLSISESWSNPPTENLQLWVFGLLAVSIGLPFFAISGNGPLLQAWFARSGHHHAGDPYFLYGASNLGSLLALLAYPVLIEPNMSLINQSVFWSTGYVALVGVILVSGIAVMAVSRLRNTDVSSAAVASNHAVSMQGSRSLKRSNVTWNDRCYWIALACVPSGLLIAVTNYITTDIAPIPFLWILPLAIFLLTFIITFQQKPIIPHAFMTRAMHLSIAAMFVIFFFPGSQYESIKIPISLLAFFNIAMTCHGELVARRPAPDQITEFYLYMSFGGMLGGIFTALLAPQIFSFIAEYPIMILLAAFLRPGFWNNLSERLAEERKFLTTVFLICAFILGGLYALNVPFKPYLVQFSVTIFVCALIFWQGNVVRFAGLTAIFIASALFMTTTMKRGEHYRGFFGVLHVADTADKKFRILYHGTTIHGAQNITKNISEDARLEPLTYYHWGSPFADVFNLRKEGYKNRIAAVGLGTGTLACYAKPGEDWRFFEIDPLVAKIARDKTKFTFLDRCTPNAPIVLGDARLTLQADRTGKYDIIILDAFSSDAIPMHLLTLEAFEGYLSKLADDGVLAVHISNRHIVLAPVLSAVARKLGLSAVVKIGGRDRTKAKIAAQVVALARNPDRLAPLKADKKWHALPAPVARVWTDDYSNLLGSLSIFNR